MKENLLMKYAEQLAVEIELLCQSLSKIKDCSNTVFQIRKSSSSVFANVTEAQYPQSRADMISKFEIALKEANETENWLNIILRAGFVSKERYEPLHNKLVKIKILLISSIKTLKKNS